MLHVYICKPDVQGVKHKVLEVLFLQFMALVPVVHPFLDLKNSLVQY